MKTQVQAIICAVLIATSPMYAATNYQDAARTNQGSVSTTLKSGMYFSKDGKLNINIENTLTKAAKVQIVNEKKEVVFQKSTKSASVLSALKLNVDQLPDGEYTVEISNGKDKITKNLQLETPKSERILIVGK